jgi:uncharacterized membrane protein (UPF0127 family)
MNNLENKRIFLLFLTFWKKAPILLRSRPYVRGVFFSFVLVLTSAGLPDQANSTETELITFETSELTIITASGRHHFWVEIAKSIVQRQQGLMKRQEMPADRGMLLDFGFPQMVHMWMKNTHIPLDMIFLDEIGSITAIAANTTPFSTTVIPSPGDTRAVLELNGGTVSRLRIKVGDKILHWIF